MTSNVHDGLLQAVRKIWVYSRYGRRSPHKPLLLLSVARHLNGFERLVTFGEIERDLNGLTGDMVYQTAGRTHISRSGICVMTGCGRLTDQNS